MENGSIEKYMEKMDQMVAPIKELIRAVGAKLVEFKVPGERHAAIMTKPISHQLEVVDTDLSRYPVAVLLKFSKEDLAFIRDHAEFASSARNSFSGMQSLSDCSFESNPCIYFAQDGTSLLGVNVKATPQGPVADAQYAIDAIEPIVAIAYDETLDRGKFSEEQIAAAEELKASNARTISGKNGRSYKVDYRPMSDEGPSELTEVRYEPPKLLRRETPTNVWAEVVSKPSGSALYHLNLYFEREDGEEEVESSELKALDSDVRYEMAKLSKARIPILLFDDDVVGRKRYGDMKIDESRFLQDQFAYEFVESIAESKEFPRLSASKLDKVYELFSSD